jgi:hypothetical protein
MGRGEKPHARLIGGGLHGPRIGKERPFRDLLAAHQDGGARIARAHRHYRDADRHGEQHRHHGRAHPLGRAHQVAVLDMARLMRHHAGDLIGRIELHQKTGVDEHVLAFGDEGVNRRIVDDVEMHRRRIEIGGEKDGIEIAAQHALDFRVADQRHTASLRARRMRGIGRHRDDRRDPENDSDERPQKRKGELHVALTPSNTSPAIVDRRIGPNLRQWRSVRRPAGAPSAAARSSRPPSNPGFRPLRRFPRGDSVRASRTKGRADRAAWSSYGLRGSRAGTL